MKELQDRGTPFIRRWGRLRPAPDRSTRGSRRLTLEPSNLAAAPDNADRQTVFPTWATCHDAGWRPPEFARVN